MASKLKWWGEWFQAHSDFVGRFCHVIKESWKARIVLVGKLPDSENCHQFSSMGTNGNKAAQCSTSARAVRRAVSKPPSQAEHYRDGRFMGKMRSLLQNSPRYS